MARGGGGAAERRQEQSDERLGRLSAQHRFADAGHDARRSNDAVGRQRLAGRIVRYGGSPRGNGRAGKEGVGKARAAARAADLCLWLLDASAPPVWPGAVEGAVRFVVNKIDRPAVWDVGALEESVSVSALTGQGLPELCTALSSSLVPESPPPGAAVPFTERFCASIANAHNLLADGRGDEARRILAGLRQSL